MSRSGRPPQKDECGPRYQFLLGEQIRDTVAPAQMVNASADRRPEGQAQAHEAEIAYLVNLLAEIGRRRMFSHAKRRPASEPWDNGYEQRGCFSAVPAVPVMQREGHYEHE